MEKKIKVLCVSPDRAGVGLHRSVAPHLKLDELFGNEFDVEIIYDIDWTNLDMISKYNIVNFHGAIFEDKEAFHNALKFCKENHIITIMDLDDYWKVGTLHYSYAINNKYKTENMFIEAMQLVDYVTTTTEIFAKEIRKYNKNVMVFPNAIDSEDLTDVYNKNKSDKIRLGYVMGSSHLQDMELVQGLTNKLSSKVLDKIQICLCGFDTRGYVAYVDGNGELKQRPINPLEGVWYEYEKIVTDNYKIVSPEYKNSLMEFRQGNYYDKYETYRRLWTRPVAGYDYIGHYNDIDILIVPLKENEFNKYKSELKLVEAGITNTAVVASNFGPYQIGTKSFFEKGGVINEDGNCVLIDNMRSHKDWAKYIEKLVNNPEYIQKLKDNLHKHIIENYDMKDITRKRAEWYKEIVK